MTANMTACQKYGSKLVFFDKAYMDSRTSPPQDDHTQFHRVGRTATVRTQISNNELNATRDSSGAG